MRAGSARSGDAYGLLDALARRAPFEAGEACVGDERVQRRVAERVGAGLNAGEVAEVEHAGFDLRVRMRGADTRCRLVGLRLRATGNHHGRAGRCERARGIEADAGVRAGDEDALCGQVEAFHDIVCGALAVQGAGHALARSLWRPDDR